MSKTVGMAAVLMCLAIVGCGTKPVLNMRDVAIKSEHTTDQVRDAIIAAGATRGWVIKDAGPGQLRATIAVRTHRAEADIAYSKTSYSITYASSTDLDYKDGKIHRNYNKWIENLSLAIQEQLNRPK